MATSSASAAHTVAAQTGQTLSQPSSIDGKSLDADSEQVVGNEVSKDLNGHNEGVSRIEALCEYIIWVSDDDLGARG